MNRRDLFLCVLWVAAAVLPVGAQTIIDPGRRIDWSQAGIPAGIPVRQTICATLNPGATAAQINAAIGNCPSGQVVFLNAGSYTLTSGLDFHYKNNVTLRGAGPDRTTLAFFGSVNCSGMNGDICIRNDEANWTGGPIHVANWTGGYGKGTTQITLSSTTGLAVGSVIFLDQLNDPNVDTGSIWICSTINVCSIEGSGGGGRSNREQTQMVRVTAINGTTITITPGLHMPNWRASQSPQAWWGDTVVTGVGIEDLTVDHTNSDALGGLYFFNAYNCWVKNIKSINANRNHVWLFQTAASVVRDSYFYGTKNAATQSYGVESLVSADNLVENNIFEHITSPILSNGSVTGSVFSYNYMFDTYYTPGPEWMLATNVAHGVGIDMLLHEGNQGNEFHEDRVHGTQNFLTAFRNYFSGLEPAKTRGTNPVNIYAFNRYANLVGNVLGTPGYHNNYEWNISGSNIETSIYVLGSGGDNLVKSTLLRWANYDAGTRTVRSVTAEVPSGLTQYANPVPSATTLPPSLYLNAKPGWWSASVPWPAIGPDVAGGPGPGGHAYDIPARVCYDSTPKVGGILNFNANNCYHVATVSPPAAPTNVRIILAGS